MKPADEMTQDEAEAVLADHAHRVATVWRALDLDGDGRLTADEIDAASESLLALDTNGDGQLTIDEIGGPFRWLDGQRSSAIVRILDLDFDGIITAADIAAEPERISRLDRVGKGHLDESDDHPPQNPVRAGWYDGARGWLSQQDTIRSYVMHDTANVPHGSDPRQDPGFYLVYSHGNAFDVQISGDLYLVDRHGSKVHEWPHYLHDPETISPWLMADGRLIRTQCPDNWLEAIKFPVGAHGVISIVEPDGEVVWEHRVWEIGQRALHHDFELMPNGNILVICYQSWSFEEAIAMGWVEQRRDGLNRPEDTHKFWTEVILELEPNLETGETRVVWEWHSVDHLVQDVDPDKPNYGEIGPMCRKIDLNYSKWDNYRFNMGQIMHVNTVSYDAHRDQIMLSSAMFGELWVIDHAISTEEAKGEAGDFLYRCGNQQPLRTGDVKTFDWQHDIHWIPDAVPHTGDVLVFNNGARSCLPEFPNPHPKRLQFNGAHSEILEMTLPVDDEGNWTWSPDDPLNGAEIVWSYNADGGGDLFSPFMSGARRLPNGNTCMAHGYDKRIQEVTPDGDVVLDFRPGGPGRSFRVVPIAADHPGLTHLGLETS